METSRIANDLSNGGFDPEIQLAIAQETLRHLRDSVKDLPEIEREYADAVRGLANANSVIVKERLGKLAEEMKELKAELELAPHRIKEVENDIAMLKGYLPHSKQYARRKGSIVEGKAGGKENPVLAGRGNGEAVSNDKESVTENVENMEL
ncbi:MAG: hypothetical protein LQ346_006445 [Caloplaca aetnensis]|nr:MAG: hypothetical protein LQ346_006445 [Caloplaca aetnensis]